MELFNILNYRLRNIINVWHQGYTCESDVWKSINFDLIYSTNLSHGQHNHRKIKCDNIHWQNWQLKRFQ